MPSAEYVLAAHDAMTASAEAEHCVVTRCPGPAVEHGLAHAVFNPPEVVIAVTWNEVGGHAVQVMSIDAVPAAE